MIFLSFDSYTQSQKKILKMLIEIEFADTNIVSLTTNRIAEFTKITKATIYSARWLYKTRRL